MYTGHAAARSPGSSALRPAHPRCRLADAARDPAAPWRAGAPARL